jgi:REP element-mobilizing transposase RayT
MAESVTQLMAVCRPPASNPLASQRLARLSLRHAAGRDIWHSRGYLPHCDHVALTQFITYRLSDSLPPHAYEQIYKQLEPDQRVQFLETYLDSGYGNCILRQAKNADIIVENWKRFHEKRYLLHAWCVMPNHVHVIIELLGNYSVGEIVHSWKSYTAKRLEVPNTGGRAHSVWQPDYFDRFIRNERHFAATVGYIHRNPVLAGLVANAEDWIWSSAQGWR